MSIYIGMMSGTSLDGVDAVAVQFESKIGLKVLGSKSMNLSEELRALLLSLCFTGPDEINRSQIAGNQLAQIYAETCHALLKDLGLSAPHITAIGAHGQTVRHNPQNGATTQLLNGALLAELTQIDTIIDFRNRDIAAGGQGAPLVPAFHASVFASDEPRAIVNFGGIANVTFLGRSGEADKTFGFDCGPANILLDAWVKENLGLTYDKDAKWARTGVLDEDWLSYLYSSEPYFSQSCPKSTGRELFNLDWLNKHLPPGMKPEDVQHTLTALSAIAVAKDIEKYQPETKEVFTCGGGARNPLLMEYLQKYLPGKTVQPTDILGLTTQDVEGAAFAWLAKQFVERLPGNLPSVTGAKGPRILGALYPH